MRTPGQLPAPSGWALSNSARRVTPPGSGIAMFAVSPVSRRSCSRKGAAKVARSATLVSRRAYSTSTRPGRKPPLGPRCARPLRSSARSRRAAVLFESPVRSITLASDTKSSLSIRPTRMRAARSIDWVPSSLGSPSLNVVPAYGTKVTESHRRAFTPLVRVLENAPAVVPLCSTMTPSSVPAPSLADPASGTTPGDRGGPLTGMRVLDCSIAMAGPFAAQRLGDLGADVVKVEPVTGEWQRHVAAGGAHGQPINVSLPVAEPQQALAGRRPEEPRRPRGPCWRAGRAPPTSSCRTTGPASPSASASTTRRSARSTRDSSTSRCPATARTARTRTGPGQDLLLQAHVRRACSPPAAPASRRRRPASTWSTRSPRYARSRRCWPRCCTASARARASSSQVNMLDAITTLQMQELSVFTVGGEPQARSAEPHAHVYIRAPYGVFETAGRLHRAGVPAARASSAS